MRRKGFIPILVLALFAISSIAVVITLALAIRSQSPQQNKQTHITQSATPILKPTPTTPKIQTSPVRLLTVSPFPSSNLEGSKTYTSEKYKISLKYPDNFVRTLIAPEDEGLIIFPTEKEKQAFEDCSKPAGMEHCFGGSINISFQEKTKSNTETLENWIKENDSWVINQLLSSPDKGGLTVIDNKKAVRYKGQSMNGFGYEIFVDKETSVLEISAYEASTEQSGQLATTLDQMLSSLKFLN